MDKQSRKTFSGFKGVRRTAAGSVALAFGLMGLPAAGGGGDVADIPLQVSQTIPPIVALSMSNDHQLYTEAYNEYTDLTGDGELDRTYNHEFEYAGYFDPGKCYEYGGGVFEPAAETDTRYCDGVSGDWSGNFLNWVTMARIDVLRHMLYGGYRAIDEAGQTVLERTYLPTDTHSWARYYDGDDISLLTPFTSADLDVPQGTAVIDNEEGEIPVEEWAERFAEGLHFEREWFRFGSEFPGQPGDQVWLEDNDDRLLQGYLQESEDAGLRWRIVFQVAEGSGPADATDEWRVGNPSRVGISFCNTTYDENTYSQRSDAPPLMRVAQGNYHLWGANERWQCTWEDEESNELAGDWGYPDWAWPNSNGNVAAISGLNANTDMPDRDAVGLGEADYEVRVSVCEEGLLEDNCTEYGETESSFKPTGLLQEFGEEEMEFALITGSYERNKSGGTLRRAAGDMAGEVDPTDGTFIDDGNPSIIGSLDRLRIFGYSHRDGTYHDTSEAHNDSCEWGTREFDEGDCSNWGNPQSEILLETLRYLRGTDGPRFAADDDRYIDGLLTDDWDDPVGEDQWCAALNVVQINASSSSFDGDNLGYASDIGLDDPVGATNRIGEEEGIHGGEWFIGESGGNDDGLCTAKTVNGLGEASGICPDEPRLDGTYNMAGLAHYAHVTDDFRPDFEQGEQTVTTHGVELAPASPEIQVPDAGGEPVASLVPACREEDETPHGSCSIVDFKVMEQELTSNGSRGQFFVMWEDTEWGGDYDMDMTGMLAYKLEGSELHVTTRVFADSSNFPMAFGYVVSGTTLDGFHAHSGINDAQTDQCGSSVSCELLAPETTNTYNLGGSSADFLERPLYYAAKWGGFDREIADTPVENDESWDSSGDGIPDNYNFATDPAGLKEALEETLGGIADQVGTAASIATNSTRLDSDTLIYQARFDSEDWSGELLAFELEHDPESIEDEGSIGDLAWDAEEELPHYVQRQILTWNPDEERGVDFEYGALSDDQQEALDTNPDTGEMDGYGIRRVEWLRGSQDDEEPGGMFRERTRLIGDIVHSDPHFSHDEDFGYASMTDDEDVAEAYLEHLSDLGEERPMLYIGANDGKFHGFDAETGEEVFAFVPDTVFDDLNELTSPDYDRQYYVDGSPRAGDIWDGSDWRRIVVASLGAGGRGVFAIDVTEPEDPEVLWEINNETNGFESLGYTIGQPTLGKTAEGEWIVAFGNGYESGDGAHLFIVDPISGDLEETLTPGNTYNPDDNGLSSPTPVDDEGDHRIDWIYAGDLEGNLWIFETDDGPAGQRFGFDEPLFIAEGPNGETQPITMRPEVTRAEGNDVMVLFGTGSYFRTDDDVVGEDPDVQSVYGIRDRPEDRDVVEREDLLEQEITHEISEFDRNLRVTTDHALEPGHEGWFIDLVSPEAGPEGERSVAEPVVRGGRLVFTTLIPSEEPCDAGGESWLMEVDALEGARLARSPFDLTGDGEFTEDDMVEIDGELVAVSGKQSEVGIIRTPGIVQAGSREYKYIAGSTGEVAEVRERGRDEDGRQSWQQVR